MSTYIAVSGEEKIIRRRNRGGWSGASLADGSIEVSSGNLPALQQEYTNKDMTWLSIVSPAPGKQGYFPPGE